MRHTDSSAEGSSAWPCLRAVDGGVVLDLSVVPGAKRTELVGLHDDALRVRLAAPPIEGRANEALIAWLGDELQLPKRSITLLRGASSRRKQVMLPVTLAQATRWLDERCPRG
jgi:uncharacterized protein (TIGR00251 family)